MTDDPFNNQFAVDGVQKIIAVASGKGGVGKSTVSSLLAIGLQQIGKRVGLLDCDIYGPSIPRLFGLPDAKPEINEFRKLEPPRKFGIPTMSIGYLVDEGSAVVWRGPMLFKAIEQFLRDVMWGELDYLIVDLPPGTGDVQLTLAQKVPLAGAVIVSTPQNLALIDVHKCVDMFERLRIPILGVVENMAGILNNDGTVSDLFPKGDLEIFLEQKKIEKILSLPFDREIAAGADNGTPISILQSESQTAKTFRLAAQKIVELSNA